MARRTRRPRVQWLPPAMGNSLGENSGISRVSILPTGDVGAVDVVEAPIVIQEVDPTGTGESLADIVNSGYRLRRIVGKIWVNAAFVPGEQGLAEPSRLLVTCGIIVRRTDPTSGISLAQVADNNTGLQISPQTNTNWGDPWIWRRSWLLSNPEMELIATLKDQVTNNWGHGPAAVDGPHVDQKTARIIGPEEGLFLSASAMIVTVGSDLENPVPVEVMWDLRALGTMRSTSGNRGNSSR